ncbi:hypothetical protein BH10PLA2_BH10PLA2_29820 [soil metagenome]
MPFLAGCKTPHRQMLVDGGILSGGSDLFPFFLLSYFETADRVSVDHAHLFCPTKWPLQRDLTASLVNGNRNARRQMAGVRALQDSHPASRFGSD